jgi:hypothetical protein
MPAASQLNELDVVGFFEPEGDRCLGSFTSPSAPPGVLCVYPSNLSNATALRATGNSRFGFSLSWFAPNDAVQTSGRATWAYTED